MPNRPQDHDNLSLNPVEIVSRVGWCGVDLFFVLSGFLISHLLFSEWTKLGRINVPRFLIRRAFKIWPSYFIGYGVMVALNLIVAHWKSDSLTFSKYLATIIPNCFFFQNYCSPEVRWDNSWSIAIEEHFYLVLPLVLLLLASRQRERFPFAALPVVLFGVSVGVLVMRSLSVLSGTSPSHAYYFTHFRIDSLGTGVLLGYCWNFAPNALNAVARCWPIWGACVTLGLLTVLAFPLGQSVLTPTIGFTVLHVGFGGLVAAAVANPKWGSVGWCAGVSRTIGVIGTYSYGIYIGHSIIYHMPGCDRARAAAIALFGGGPLLDSVWCDRLLFWGTSLLAGVGLTICVERPFLALRDRVFPSGSRLVVANRECSAGGMPSTAAPVQPAEMVSK